MGRSQEVNRNRVAELAGVSSATVSRVYNYPQRVAPEKRDRVLAAAAELGYRPNKAAAALRRNTSGTIMLLEWEKPQRSYYWKRLKVFNWFYADVIHGLQEVIDTSMYGLKLKRIRHLDDAGPYMKEADGIIGFDIDRLEEARELQSLGIPYILCHHTDGFEGFHRCSTDNRLGGVLQAQYLYDQGCRRAAYLTGYLDSVYVHRERLEGFSTRCRELGMELDVYPHAMEDGQGWQDSWDAVAAVNDLTLLKMLQLAPGEAADRPLVGYDAMPIRSLVSKGFPSVDPRPREIYHRSAELLMEMLNGTANAYCTREIIKPVLVDI